MGNIAQEDDERDEIGTKGNKKGLPIWSLVKNTSLFITLCVFVLTSVLVLDAYKFVSVRHAKFARAKIFQTLQSMDPTIMESHTGMKVLSTDEYTQLQSELDKSRKDARQMNAQVQLKFSQVLETTTAVEKMKKDIEELKKMIGEKEADVVKETKPEGGAAEVEKKVADDAKEEEKKKPDDAEVKLVEKDTTKENTPEKDEKGEATTIVEEDAAKGADAKLVEGVATKE